MYCSAPNGVKFLVKKLTQMERLVLRDLSCSGSGLHVYTFWRRYRLPVAQLAGILRRFIAKKVVKFDGSLVELTHEGRDWLVRNRIQLLPPREKPWRECPEHFLQPKLSVNAPITPLLSKMDGSLRPKKRKKTRVNKLENN